MNTVQWVSLARAIVIVIGGIAMGFGWATQADIDAVSRPEVLAPVVGGIAAAVSIFYGWRARRTSKITDTAAKLDPHGVVAKVAASDPSAVIAATAALPQVGAIVTTSPSAANAVLASNVVPSLTEAARVPGVPTH